MLEQVMLVQFVEGLLMGTLEWVRCHRPPDLTAAVTLVEYHLAVHHKGQAPEGQPPTPGRPTPAACQ